MLAVNTYRDRTQAGKVVAQHLAHYLGEPDLLVLGLPRGGVPVALEVARFLHAPLDVFVVRKLGLPGHEELAMGAVAPGGIRLLNDEVIEEANVSAHDVDRVTQRELAELERREKVYRGTRPAPEYADHSVFIVDDGVATGFSLRAAVAAVQRHNPAQIIVAVPVGAPETCDELAQDAQEVICPLQPTPFHAVGVWYDHFAPTTDDEVRACLREADRLAPARKRLSE